MKTELTGKVPDGPDSIDTSGSNGAWLAAEMRAQKILLDLVRPGEIPCEAAAHGTAEAATGTATRGLCGSGRRTRCSSLQQAESGAAWLAGSLDGSGDRRNPQEAAGARSRGSRWGRAGSAGAMWRPRDALGEKKDSGRTPAGTEAEDDLRISPETNGQRERFLAELGWRCRQVGETPKF